MIINLNFYYLSYRIIRTITNNTPRSPQEEISSITTNDYQNLLHNNSNNNMSNLKLSPQNNKDNVTNEILGISEEDEE